MYTNTEDSDRRPRRRYSADFKQELVQLCRQPSMSVASVARRHGINHNIVHRLIRQQTPSTPALNALFATKAKHNPKYSRTVMKYFFAPTFLNDFPFGKFSLHDRWV